MLRRILGAIVGMVAAGAVIFGVETLGHLLYPPPPELDPRNAEEFQRYVSGLPAGALVIVLLAFLLGSFVGGAVATLVAGRGSGLPALAVGILLTLGGVANLMMIPHPLWFAILSVAIYMPLAWLGYRVALRIGSARQGLSGTAARRAPRTGTTPRSRCR